MFSSNFFLGTSTAAAQVETAGAHPWRGLRALDGHVFERTTDHEQRRAEDAEYIARLGTVYRCGVDWSRLQAAPGAPFDPEVVREYRDFFTDLQRRGVRLMFVLHHFCHPNWFEAAGGWTDGANTAHFLDYTAQCLEHFGEFAGWWNTFNEPNVYAMNGFILGNFPPRRKGQYFTANQVLDNMGKAHEAAYALIKKRYPDAPIGISLNTACFEGLNLPGKMVARFVDWWFHERAAQPFERCDFWGISYYAFMLFDPLPVDAISRRAELERRGIPHDKMWGYKPEGLLHILRRFHKKYHKPVIITENGVCTDDAHLRIHAIKDYLKVCADAWQEGVDVLGYIHWSTWDNFEWHLGPSYRFGLVRVDFDTMARTMTPAGEFYERLVQERRIPE